MLVDRLYEGGTVKGIESIAYVDLEYGELLVPVVCCPSPGSVDCYLSVSFRCKAKLKAAEDVCSFRRGDSGSDSRRQATPQNADHNGADTIVLPGKA